MRSGGDVPVFRSRVNLVMVPVVVRDSHGNSIGDLRREDFQLLDDGKPQAIKHFAVERPEAREAAASAEAAGKGETKTSAAPKVPRRFIAWVIDDYHLEESHAVLKAADRMLGELRPGDRVAIYSVSGVITVDFTDDIPALRKAVSQLGPGEKFPLDRTPLYMSERELIERPFKLIRELVRVMSIRPGERSIVLVSDGWMVDDRVKPDLPEVLDQAIRANVVINSLEARGVYTLRVGATAFEGAQAAMKGDILEYLADGTGGVYFHSDNSMYEGFRRTSEAAEYRYILGFSPKEWHSDKDFHRLKVKVDRPGVTIQARRGYSFDSPEGVQVRTSQPNRSTPASKEAGNQAPGTSLTQVESNPSATTKNSDEKLPTFKSQVNLVTVPVVVRDAKGNVIGNLWRENFRVFDNGKQQKIKQFSIESAPSRIAGTGDKAETGKASEAKPSAAPPAARRSIAYVFDDLHLDAGDLVPARKAAERQLAALEPGERVALYTSSGRNSVEFTDNTAKLREALLRITPRAQVHECPDLGAHWAAQIEELGYNTSNPVVSAAMGEFRQCPGNSGMPQSMLQGMLRGVVSRILSESERDAQLSVALLRNVVTRMSALPGERTIVTISPGFMPRHQEQQLAQVIEHAVQARVVVNTLDARGVYTSSMFDASNDSPPSPQAMQVRMEMASLQADVLEELADGTGGLFFHSNNDMNEGFRKTAGVAEYTYMLGFTPEIEKNPKVDPYHTLKVKVEGAGRGLIIQARRGYRVDTNPVEPLREEEQQIRMAMYSVQDMTEIPMKLGTEVWRTSEAEARLKVVVHLDLKSLPLRKVNERNSDDVEVHVGVFDRNGKYVAGKGNRVELRLLDQTVEQLNSGATLAQASNLDMDFNLKPGDYMVRVVAREAESQLMSTASATVQIR